jgi:molybdate transport system substrate-binding protein
MRAVLLELKPRFEELSHNALTITFGSALPLKRDLDAGAAFDVAVLTPALLAELAAAGKVEADSVADVARSGIGVAARQGAPRGDVSSPESLKRTLLAAKSVAYSREGQSGLAAAKVIERLGITEQMKPRVLLETRPGGGVAAVIEGRAELGIGLLSEIVPEPQALLLGPMPGDLQSYVVFAAGVSAHAADPAAARAFVDFLRGPQVRAILKAKGLEGL